MTSEKRGRIFSNERTVASAGSGKTYALTSRFIALSTIYPPRSICALTFSRTAAAEFMDKILDRIAGAAESEGDARRLADEVEKLGGRKGMSRGDFAELLEKIVSDIPRLDLRTIDSFEARFVQAFASELGILGGIKIIGEFERKRAEAESLRAVFQDANRSPSDSSRLDEILSHISGGKNSKRLFDRALKFLQWIYPIYCSFPYKGRWGNVKLLSNTAFPVEEWDQEAYASRLGELEESLRDKVSGKVSRDVGSILTFFKKSSVGDVSSSKAKGLSEFIEMLRDGRICEGGSAELSIGKTLLSETQKKLLLSLSKMLFGACLGNSLRAASAMGKFAERFEMEYSRRVRMAGFLRFDDIPVLLSDPSFDAERGMVEYRLDARHDHWLLDEFQDTSRLQWRALSGLLEEILQDTSGERTLYYVGDKKQSLYSWRGGAPELFDEIFNAHNGNINDGEPLNVSYRSSKPVIDAVNLLFSDADSLSGFNEGAGKVWGDMWSRHSSHPSLGNNGCAAFLERESGESVAEAVYRILFEIKPWERGLSCAILVQRNDLAVSIVEDLRRFADRDGLVGFSADSELESGITGDNMVVPAVLKLLHCAFHPTDSAAEAYVRMTPLAGFLDGDAWRAKILQAASDGGMERAVGVIGEYVLKAVSDGFSLARLSALSSCAAEFDASECGLDIDSFESYAASYTVRERTEGNMVRVMTIHKSKGLGFDIVIMPQLDNPRSASDSVKLVKMEASDGGEVVIALPPSNICAMDPQLFKCYEKIRETEALGRICSFYVGVTRSKKALYLISDGSWKKGTAAYSFAEHAGKAFEFAPESVKCGMGTRVAFGDWDWFSKIPALTEPREEVKSAPWSLIANAGKPASNFVFMRPSDNNMKFPRRRYSRAVCTEHSDFGELVHRAFALLEDASDVDGVPFKNFERLSEHSGRAVELVKSCLSNSDISRYFNAGEFAEIYREYPFVCSDSGALIKGVFDRVNIRISESGGKEVDVLDFKASSESGADLLHKYSGQMSAYKTAARKLFGTENVSLWIVDVNSSGILRFI